MNDDVNCDLLLLRISEACGGRAGQTVDLRSAKMPPFEPRFLYRAVLRCTETGDLLYEGAGPRVSLTLEGAARASALLQSKSPPPEPPR